MRETGSAAAAEVGVAAARGPTEARFRRDLLAGTAAVGTALFAGPMSAATQAKKTFTVLHSNVPHSRQASIDHAAEGVSAAPLQAATSLIRP